MTILDITITALIQQKTIKSILHTPSRNIVLLTWKMLTWMYGTENMALQMSMQSKAPRVELNPDTLISSQYCENRPRTIIRTV